MGKFNQDAKWGGLKGYITNTDLKKDLIIENYGHLWKTEKAFSSTFSILATHCRRQGLNAPIFYVCC
jgi:hypothetical protein